MRNCNLDGAMARLFPEFPPLTALLLQPYWLLRRKKQGPGYVCPATEQVALYRQPHVNTFTGNQNLRYGSHIRKHIARETDLQGNNDSQFPPSDNHEGAPPYRRHEGGRNESRCAPKPNSSTTDKGWKAHVRNMRQVETAHCSDN